MDKILYKSPKDTPLKPRLPISDLTENVSNPNHQQTKIHTSDPTHLVLQTRNLQHRLPEILPLQHAQKPVNRMINPLGHALFHLETAVRDPLGHVLLVVGGIFGTHVWIGDDEAAHGEALCDEHDHVFDAVHFRGGGVVVLGYHSACDCAGRGARVSVL